ncbi:MAG: hypothetical protein OXU71_08305 [Gammaproteobacteria bacterium]|nr:hypothetical protein [Gammaproteobacteria bacterium]
MRRKIGEIPTAIARFRSPDGKTAAFFHDHHTISSKNMLDVRSTCCGSGGGCGRTVMASAALSPAMSAIKLRMNTEVSWLSAGILE